MIPNLYVFNMIRKDLVSIYVLVSILVESRDFVRGCHLGTDSIPKIKLMFDRFRSTLAKNIDVKNVTLSFIWRFPTGVGGLRVFKNPL